MMKATTGDLVDPKAAAETVSRIRDNFKIMWERLSEADATADKLRITARDFMASQYMRVTGTPWKGKKSLIGAIDFDGSRPPAKWTLDTKLATECTQVRVYSQLPVCLTAEVYTPARF